MRWKNNRSGPKTNPCGTPQILKWLLSDSNVCKPFLTALHQMHNYLSKAALDKTSWKIINLAYVLKCSSNLPAKGHRPDVCFCDELAIRNFYRQNRKLDISRFLCFLAVYCRYIPHSANLWPNRYQSVLSLKSFWDSNLCREKLCTGNTSNKIFQNKSNLNVYPNS